MVTILAGPCWGMALVELSSGEVRFAVANPSEWGDNYTAEKWASCRSVHVHSEDVHDATEEFAAMVSDRMADTPTVDALKTTWNLRTL